MYSRQSVLEAFRQEEYQNLILQNIKLQHQIYTTPIDGIYFEEIINNGLLKLGIETDWNALDRSHKQGVDVCGYSLKTCRLKSGKFASTSFRTTSQKTLEDKLKYVNQIGESIDGYVVCMKDFNKKTGNLKYHIYQFDHGIDFLDVNNFQFESCESGYIGKSGNVTARITFSMSHQLIFSGISFDDMKKNEKCHLICSTEMNIGE